MHDKQVRRRRAVLILLVAVSLILLTAYFGETPTSPLHSVQRGVVEVLSPVEQGASKVLTPVRSAASWVSDTLHAKSQVKQLQAKVQQLTAQLAQAKGAQLENGLLHVDLVREVPEAQKPRTIAIQVATPKTIEVAKQAG